MATMSLGDHLEELRRHLILALLGLAAGVVVTMIPPFYLGREIVREMQEPAERALAAFYSKRASQRATVAEAGGSYTAIPARIPADAFVRATREAFPALQPPNAGPPNGRYIELPLEVKDSTLVKAVEANIDRNNNLIALGPLEPALIFFRVCLVAGLVLASPWVFYQAWAFVAAGLYRHERAYVYRLLPHSLGLFLAGVFLCYFAVLPVTLRFLLEFNVWLGVTPMLRLSEWMGFATILPVVFGLCFQTPLVMLFLSRIGIFTAEDYRAKRRPAILIITIVAAVLTPGIDVSSMLFLSIPMILLYELGILLVRDTRPVIAR